MVNEAETRSAVDSADRPTFRRRWIAIVASAAMWLSSWAVGACERAAPINEVPELMHEGFDVEVLVGEIINESPILGRPTTLEMSGPILWIRDGTGDPYLHALDSRTGGILQSVGRKGAGPGEFDTLFDLTVRGSGDGSVWAFDLRLQRLTKVEPEVPPGEESRLVHLEGAPRVVRAAWLGDNEIVGVTEHPRSRFVVFDSTGARLDSIPGPLLGDRTVPEPERQKATITGFALCPLATGRFGIVYHTAGRVEFYGGSGRSIDTASVPYSAPPNFVVSERTRSPQWSYHRVWYVDCDATERHFYALFAGRTLSGMSPDERGLARYLHVFSENGNLRRVFELDPPVGHIQVDEEAGVLYGASAATAIIYRFRLPSTS